MIPYIIYCSLEQAASVLFINLFIKIIIPYQKTYKQGRNGADDYYQNQYYSNSIGEYSYQQVQTKIL